MHGVTRHRRLNYLCNGLRRFFKHALPEVERIAHDIRQQRSVNSELAQRRPPPANHTQLP
jgi:sulfatase maturation enzyme AslB (radical SAM superfamily)